MRPAGGTGLAVTAELVAAYADAVGAAASDIAPPLLSVIAGYPLLFAAVDSVAPAGARSLAVHGDHEVAVVRPVRTGDVLHATASVEAVRASKPGTSVAVRISVADDQGKPVAVHRAVAIVRGVQPAAESGESLASPPRDPVEWTGAAPMVIRADQPLRYARATGDHNAVHVDDGAARQAGFPGVIAHGLGVFGMTLAVLVERLAGGDQAAVRLARVRFGPAVLPGQELTVQWAAGGSLAAFRVLDESGTAVLKAGRVEFG